MNNTKFNLLLLFFCSILIVSCEEDSILNTGFDDPNIPICIDCGGGTPTTPSTGGGGTETPNPPPPTVSRYELGKITGKEDADDIFHSYHQMHNKNSLQCGGTYSDDPEKWVPNYPTYNECKASTFCNLDYTKLKVCYTELYRNASDDFRDHLINYRNNIQEKIDINQDAQFNSGLLYGLNYQMLKYSVNYGIPMP